MSASRSTSRTAALVVAALALVAVVGVAPASAAPVVTIDPIPGGPLLTPATGPLALTVSGDADPGTVLTLQTKDGVSGVEAQVCGPVTSDGLGRWTCTIAAVDDYIGQLRALEGASPLYAEPLSIITAPALTGTPARGADDTPTISGTVPAGGVSTEIAVTVNAATACTVTVAPGASWSCDVTAGLLTADGPYTIGATQTKDFGAGQFRTSSTTTATYVLDTTGPTVAATFTAPATSPLTVATTGLAFAGTGEPGGEVAVRRGATTLCGPVTVSGGGAWSCAATLPGAGTYTLTLAHTDALGNPETVPSSSVVVIVDLPVVIPTPSIYVAPPPVDTPPPPAVVPETTTINGDFTMDPSDLKVDFMTAEPRKIARNMAVQSLDEMCNGLPGSPDDNGCESPFVTVGTQLPDVVLPTGWAFYPECDGEADQAGCQFLATVKAELFVMSEPVLLDSAMLGEEPTTLSGVIPADLEPGEHHLVLVLTDTAHPEAEPVEVRVPITVVDAEPTEPGFPWWAWLLVALAAVAAVAVVVLVVRRSRA